MRNRLLIMKFLNFNFCHPFKGNAKLIRLSNTLSKSHDLIIDSIESNSFEIPVDECDDGEWKVILNWRQDNMSFSYEKIFQVKDFNVLDKEVC